MMKILIILLGFVCQSALHAQLKHSIDFDDSYFKRPVYSRWIRDPFKNPPGFAKTPADKTTWPKLTTINKKAKNPYAVLDGKRYFEGQYISEDRFISSIGENYVIVTEGNFDYELAISAAKRDLASDSEVPNNEKK